MPLSSKAAYKKLLGVIQLTDSYLQWTQDGKGAPSVRIPHNQAAALFCSKEGAARVALKVTLLNEPQGAGYNFTFTAEPQSKAVTERDAFKNDLFNIIAQNRTGATPTKQTTAAPTLASVATRNGGPPPPRATPVLSAARSTAPTPMSRASSVAPDGRSTTPFGAESAADFRLRKNVLLANPELANLHKELVMSGQISEGDFWEGRGHLLAAQATFEAQRKGRPGQLVDPRPQTVDGNTKIIITPQLVHDIFEEYPVVAKAYTEVVPNELKEEEFWTRYFQSKLFEAHRASIRSAAAQHVVRDDPIFDKYLEKDDDELEPRRIRADGVDTFIDLGASAEDHGETGNEKDVTMQAGRQRATLPLIRKFNEHSERLLKAMGDEPPSKRRRTEGSELNRVMELDLDDLHDPEASTNIVLEMKEQQRYFEGQSTAELNGDGAQKLEPAAMKRDALSNMESWTEKLSQLKIERKAGEAALVTMTQNVSARMESKLRKNDLPASLFRQMTTCQTAANEFLRQFWLALYPPASEAPPPPGGAAAAAAQRKQKAAKMAEYLAKTPEKVDALIRAAKRDGVDVSRVEVAMRPILDAVHHALAFHRSRQAAPARR